MRRLVGVYRARRATPVRAARASPDARSAQERGVNHGYSTKSKADCVAINGKSGDKRLKQAKTLELKASDYTFRVVNKNVPYELGFWLRSKGYDWPNPLHKVTKTSVSGGGLTQGTTKDYKVTLKPGEYVYSCPLNTTPDYPAGG